MKIVFGNCQDIFLKLLTICVLFFRHGDSQVWWIVFGVICLLTAATRFYKVGEPEHVV